MWSSAVCGLLQEPPRETTLGCLYFAVLRHEGGTLSPQVVMLPPGKGLPTLGQCQLAVLVSPSLLLPDWGAAAWGRGNSLSPENLSLLFVLKIILPPAESGLPTSLPLHLEIWGLEFTVAGQGSPKHWEAQQRSTCWGKGNATHAFALNLEVPQLTA